MAKKKVRVYLDLDGVVFNSSKGTCNLFGVNENNPQTRQLLRTNFEFLQLVTKRKDIKEVLSKRDYTFWENLELLPWAKTLHDTLSELGDFAFLTSPGRSEEAGKGKMLALRKHFPNTKLIVTKNKEFCASPISILIDDKEENVRKFRKWGGHSLLWPNQYLLMDGDKSFEKTLSKCLTLIRKVKKTT